jgi:ribosomal protein L13
MLPWDRAKGQEAHKKLMCYVGNGNLKEEEIKQAKILDFKKPLKYISIKEIIKLL